MGTPMDRTNRVFAQLSTFDDVFPELEDVEIEYTESGHFEYPGSQGSTRVHSVRRQGGLIRCSNPACRQGGYEMDFDIHDMIRGGVSEREGHKMCAGSEGSPKLRRIYRKCLDAISYKIKLVHKKVS